MDIDSENPRTVRRLIQTGTSFKIGGLLDDRRSAGGSGFSPKRRIAENIEAIRTLKKIEQEGRLATEEEKRILVRYSGWGALADVLDRWNLKPEYVESWKILEGLLDDREMRSAVSSVNNAHFTSPDVIEAMWKSAVRLGFRGGSVLEPSMGIGHFIGMCPADIAEKSKFYGVELDSISGRIADALYGEKSVVQIGGFERSGFAKGYFDLVIGNVPFGDYAILDPEGKIKGQSIHNFFLMKSLDMVHPGGLTMLLTSRYTLDSKDSSVRKAMSGKFEGDFVGGFRLPSEAMKSQAGTDAIMDVLIFQKRGGQNPLPAVSPEEWLSSSAIDPKARDSDSMNGYFSLHPEHVFGEISIARGMYRDNELVVRKTSSLGEKIASLPLMLPEGGVGETVKKEERISSEGPFSKDGDGLFYPVVDEGKWIMGDGGEILQVRNRKAVSARITKKEEAFYRGFIHLRDSVRELLKVQSSARVGGGADILLSEQGRERVNVAYDALVELMGNPLSHPDVVDLYDEDPDSPLILALENYDEEKNLAEKTNIFFEDILKRQEVKELRSALDAVSVSMDRYGEIREDEISALYGKPWDEIMEELGKEIFRDHKTFRWVTSAEYLSGNVRIKLSEARKTAMMDASFERNVKALEEVQPEDLKPSQISVNLGVPWIDKQYFGEFAGSLLNDFSEGRRPQLVDIEYNSVDAKWALSFSGYSEYMYRKWGTQDVSAITLIEQAMNQQSPTVTRTVEGIDGSATTVTDLRATEEARATQIRIRERFASWIWQDVDRAEAIMSEYNSRFRSIVLRKFDGSALTIPGMNDSINLRPHQKDAIMRIVQTKDSGVLLAHAVGAGKTMEMIGGMMESRRLGIAKKPVAVVPNHLVAQFASEVSKMYPLSKVLITTKKDLKKERRRAFASKVAMGDWDMIVMAHSTFSRIPVSAETERAFIQERLDEYAYLLLSVDSDYANTKARKKTLKGIEASKKRMEVRLLELSNRSSKDEYISWDELGIDCLVVDEAHLFKGLEINTKMQIAGLTTNRSQRAMDLSMKISHLAKVRGDRRGVVFATGTPITNVMAELYNIQKMLDPEGLKEAGIDHFDAWAATFGEVVSTLEITPDGNSYRVNTRFSKFFNIPELMLLYWRFSDVKRREDLNLPTPEFERITQESERSPFLENFMEKLGERADAVRSRVVEPTEDNMLKISSDGRKAALSINMINSLFPIDPESKVHKCSENLFGIWSETKEDRLTQMVFCDIGTPGQDDEERYSVYGDIKQILVRKGIPSHEIAFIHDAEKDEEKEELFEKVRSGEVRILIGSTEKMGAGTNVQNKLCALHHLDAPWRPSDLEQREGRILRQGNNNKNVKIFTYVTKDSFDLFMWETLKRKAGFINQVNNGDKDVRSIDESMDPNYAEVMAMITGNSLIRDKIKLDQEVARLVNVRGAWEDGKFSTVQEIRATERAVTRLVEERGRLEQNLKYYPIPDPEKFSIEIDGSVFRDKDKAKQALVEAWNKAKPGDRIGTYANMILRKLTLLTKEFDETSPGGFRISSFNGVELVSNLPSHLRASFAGCERAPGTALRNIIQAVSSRTEKIESVMEGIRAGREKIENLTRINAETFPEQEKLELAEKKRAEIVEQLHKDLESSRKNVQKSSHALFLLPCQIYAKALSLAIGKEGAEAEVSFSREGVSIGGEESTPYHKLMKDFAGAEVYGNLKASFKASDLLEKIGEIGPGSSGNICLTNMNRSGEWTVSNDSRIPHLLYQDLTLSKDATVEEKKEQKVVFEIPVSRNGFGVALARAYDLASGKLSKMANPFNKTVFTVRYGEGLPFLDVSGRSNDVFATARIPSVGSDALPFNKTEFSKEYFSWELSAEKTEAVLSKLRELPEIFFLSWKDGNLNIKTPAEGTEDSLFCLTGTPMIDGKSAWNTASKIEKRNSGSCSLFEIRDKSANIEKGSFLHVSDVGKVNMILDGKSGILSGGEDGIPGAWFYPSRLKWLASRMNEDSCEFGVASNGEKALSVWDTTRDGVLFRSVIAPVPPNVTATINATLASMGKLQKISEEEKTGKISGRKDESITVGVG